MVVSTVQPCETWKQDRIYLEGCINEQELLDKLRVGITGDATDEEVIEVSEAIIEAGISARCAIDEATKAIREVGDDFEKGRNFSRN